ncbi:MAG: S8 family serine peptidase [Thermoleophilia bacterium]|nr:S8 family serine peptidase [Thermoleophilia bacterium]
MRRPATLMAAAVVLAGAAATAQAAEPRAAEQDWLPRVVPSGLNPPTGPAPAIAVIAGGVDLTHPDLAGGAVAQRRLRAPADAAAAEEGVARGTAIASVIGAPRDGAGIEGVLPGARVRVYGTDGTCRDAARAMRRAAGDGAGVVLAGAPFTGAARCDELGDAVAEATGAGALVVAPAGDGPLRPAPIRAGDGLHVLTVAALDSAGGPAGISAAGSRTDIAAPGASVFAATPFARDLTDGAADGYARQDGTHLAAAMVAAAAAWILAERPGLSPDQVASVLRLTARDLGAPGRDSSTGHGALDLAAALGRAAPPADSPEPDDDVRWIDGTGAIPARPTLLQRARTATVAGRLDTAVDPRDVHPLRLPPGGQVTVRLAARGRLPVDLYAWQPTAESVLGGDGADLISAGRRPRLATETLRILNDGPTAATMWVEVRADATERRRSGGYLLTATR